MVLGTSQYDGRPSRQFAARLDHAADLWRQHGRCEVITVGGKLPGDRTTEAAAGKAYLEEPGIPGASITAIPTGTDTRSSLEAVAGELAGRRREASVPAQGQRSGADAGANATSSPQRRPEVTLITDPLHVPRCVLIARQVGLRAKGSGTPSSPTQFPRRSWWKYAAHEAGGLAVVGVELAERAAGAEGNRLARIIERGLRAAESRLK